MAIIFTNTAKENTLTYLTGGSTTPESLVLRLYSNDKTPSSTDVTADYTEFSGGGYSSITLTPANWTISGGSAIYPQQSWTFNAAATDVYGYYLVTETSNELIFAERFSGGPYSISASGDIVRVTLNLNLS